MRSSTITLLCAIMSVATAAAALEKPISLKQAPGLDEGRS